MKTLARLFRRAANRLDPPRPEMPPAAVSTRWENGCPTPGHVEHVQLPPLRSEPTR